METPKNTLPGNAGAQGRHGRLQPRPAAGARTLGGSGTGLVLHQVTKSPQLNGTFLERDKQM